ncbi:MAG: hypothetical protein COV91_01965 [Candidatus Taylorbacteria bacterium CG11_big_fil_rev_8_21_14_0_20_46_11]|uniref:DUF8128 domain-containing protein n=1 Tax=Candidatus Taylorbacteria bacterium CG11_big_fil_rev_8_21_14_0_20_46_11 TaxID=1975025 RepID=A0A2H0KC31_9BACT|nr:MAG: hypothetical protein COV91_01965 [Candidatus Taylorbacteria bacterium CG11_big_fil_rev_8_21_14_0_20_46_11]
MSSDHHHGPFSRLIHYAEHLLEIASELAWELVMKPRNPHHVGEWILLVVSVLMGTTMLAILYLHGQVFEIAPAFKQAFSFVFWTYPIWLPFFLFKIFMELWLRYVRFDFLRRNPGILMEVRIPMEIEKTPRSMELLMMALYETGSVEINETYWEGKVRPWWSFEIASFGGELHFYIWTFPKYKNVLEAQVYAQYPTVELIEVEDYTKKKVYNPPHNFMWGTYFVLSRPDPYPIMTYVDYGLDKETEEEFKVDPLSATLEYLGSMKKGEEVWIQILAQAYKRRGLIEGVLFKEKDWIAEGQKEINKIMKRDPHTKSSRSQTESGFPIVPTLSDGEKKQLEAIDRSLEKRAFWCTIRLCYHAEPPYEYRSASVSGLLGAFRKPFNSNLLNGFSLGWYTDVSDMTKDILFLFGLKNWAMNKFIPIYAKSMIDAFRRRSFFYVPYRNWQSKPYILTTEELATLFHFPGKIVTTPTLERIPSKKVEPPSNLPI